MPELIYNLQNKWVKVLKNGPSKICGRQPVCLGRAYHFKFFKFYLPQVLLSPFLNTLTDISRRILLRTLLNFYDGALLQKLLTAKVVIYFCKSHEHRYLRVS